MWHIFNISAKYAIFVAYYNISARCAPFLPNVERWKVCDW